MIEYVWQLGSVWRCVGVCYVEVMVVIVFVLLIMLLLLVLIIVDDVVDGDVVDDDPDVLVLLITHLVRSLVST